MRTAIRFTEHLALEGIAPSIGTVGDAYDNGLMESVTSSPSARCVGRESIGEHARTAQRDVVATVNLVGLHPEPLAGVATCPLGGEDAVLTAQQVLRPDLRPRRQWPRLAQRPGILPRSRRLASAASSGAMSW